MLPATTTRSTSLQMSVFPRLSDSEEAVERQRHASERRRRLDDDAAARRQNFEHRGSRRAARSSRSTWTQTVDGVRRAGLPDVRRGADDVSWLHSGARLRRTH